MNDTTRSDTAHLDEEVERELAAYASARLTPDRWATNRMRVAVVEQGALTLAAGAPRRTGVGGWHIGLRRLAPIGLVAAIAVLAGSGAALAASPGGPLYGLRVQVESALLPPSGAARTDAQVGLLNERTEEITDALANGNAAGADAAANAYSDQVDQALANAASQRSQLIDLRATLVRQLGHFQSLAKPNDKAGSNLQRLIAKTQAAIAEVDRELAALQ